MPLANRQQTVTAWESVVDPDLFNAVQDRLEMLVPMTESLGSIGAGVPPTSFRGGVWLYQQFCVPAGTTLPLDLSFAYWGAWTPATMTPKGVNYHDWRYRISLMFAMWASGATEQPNGANHWPSSFAANDFAWIPTCLRDEGDSWQPFPVAFANLTLFADNDGGLYARNTDAADCYFFLYGLFTKPINEETAALHRVKSFADYARFSESYYHGHQDRAVMLWEANQEEGALPAAFLGATTLYGEFTSVAGADTLLDDSRDWRNTMALMHVGIVNPGLGRLPHEANHKPSNIASTAWQLWCTKAGVAVGGPFGVGVCAWTIAANMNIYADNANGHLYLSNDTGADIDFYLTSRMTGKIS